MQNLPHRRFGGALLLNLIAPRTDSLSCRVLQFLQTPIGPTVDEKGMGEWSRHHFGWRHGAEENGTEHLSKFEDRLTLSYALRI